MTRRPMGLFLIRGRNMKSVVEGNEPVPELEPVPEEETVAPPRAASPKKKLRREAKPPLSRREVEKPLKQKRLAREEFLPEEAPRLPPQGNWYEQMIQMRNQQAMARHQAMLAPYQNMFASRAR